MFLSGDPNPRSNQGGNWLTFRNHAGTFVKQAFIYYTTPGANQSTWRRLYLFPGGRLMQGSGTEHYNPPPCTDVKSKVRPPCTLSPQDDRVSGGARPAQGRWRRGEGGRGGREDGLPGTYNSPSPLLMASCGFRAVLLLIQNPHIIFYNIKRLEIM